MLRTFTRTANILLALILSASIGSLVKTLANANPEALSNAPSEGAYKGCPSSGDGGDTVLNELKNRSGQPSSRGPTTIAEILQLPYSTQVGRMNPRSVWTEQNLSLVNRYETTGVEVEGYLRKVKREGMEHCNCERADLNDFHMWIIANPADSPDKSVVVEATPRWRGSNPNWNLTVLQHMVAQHSRVRITGWMMFDQEHPEQLHATAQQPIIRGTLWEIHPVTKIEVFSGGQWREL